MGESSVLQLTKIDLAVLGFFSHTWWHGGPSFSAFSLESWVSVHKHIGASILSSVSQKIALAYIFCCISVSQWRSDLLSRLGTFLVSGGFSPEVQALLLSVRLVFLSQLGTSPGTETGHALWYKHLAKGQSCSQQPTAQVGQDTRDAEETMTSSIYTWSSYLRIQPNLNSRAKILETLRSTLHKSLLR